MFDVNTNTCFRSHTIDKRCFETFELWDMSKGQIMHFHLYMDESGQFEEGRPNNAPIIFGMLVPEESRDSLARQYEQLRQDYRLPEFTHGMALFKDQNYRSFLKKLLDLSLQSPLQFFSMKLGKLRNWGINMYQIGVNSLI